MYINSWTFSLCASLNFYVISLYFLTDYTNKSPPVFLICLNLVNDYFVTIKNSYVFLYGDCWITQNSLPQHFPKELDLGHSDTVVITVNRIRGFSVSLPENQQEL